MKIIKGFRFLRLNLFNDCLKKKRLIVFSDSLFDVAYSSKPGDFSST